MGQYSTILIIAINVLLWAGAGAVAIVVARKIGLLGRRSR
jgi:hypothetical protein